MEDESYGGGAYETSDPKHPRWNQPVGGRVSYHPRRPRTRSGPMVGCPLCGAAPEAPCDPAAHADTPASPQERR